ncbi:hypothetical protein NT01EI_3853 [Edwardsiella ictaluri 93-146]|uniref:Uncharacterized protein n=1 Tax=Edwardsiella ictaluri (strain 93-146) TaxID=634503 RepID=C5BC67_EDWI9|nr:hypothetical protein NT01EI_3853 [Edwardsiella ictaluri 93-146]
MAFNASGKAALVPSFCAGISVKRAQPARLLPALIGEISL